MTPQQLLDRIHHDRAMLAALWSGLSEEQMLQRPGPQVDWSVKDLIAHVTWWESFILSRIVDLMNGVKSAPADPQDRLNSQSYEQQRDTLLAEVLAEYAANWIRLEALIASLSDEQINTPAYYPTYDGVALLPILEAGTFGHYPSHLTDLQAYVEKQTNSPAKEISMNAEMTQ